MGSLVVLVSGGLVQRVAGWLAEGIAGRLVEISGLTDKEISRTKLTSIVGGTAEEVAG